MNELEWYIDYIEFERMMKHKEMIGGIGFKKLIQNLSVYYSKSKVPFRLVQLILKKYKVHQ